MAGRWRIAAACALAALPATRVAAGDVPTLRLRAPVSGATVAAMSRTDGGFPFRADAARDRAACLSSPKAVPLRSLRRVLALASGDRDAAFVEANRIVAACLASKGWRIAFCGDADGQGCPEGGLAFGAAEGDEHE